MITHCIMNLHVVSLMYVHVCTLYQLLQLCPLCFRDDCWTCISTKKWRIWLSKFNVIDMYACKHIATQTPKLLASLFSMAIIIIYIEDYKHDTEFRMCSAHDYCSNGCLSWNTIVHSPTWLSLNGFIEK